MGSCGLAGRTAFEKPGAFARDLEGIFGCCAHETLAPDIMVTQSQSRSRNATLLTFPVAFNGSASRMTTERGTL
jgi:hypothetical protein